MPVDFYRRRLLPCSGREFFMGKGFPLEHNYKGDWVKVEELITTLGGTLSAKRTNNVTDILLVGRDGTPQTRLREIIDGDREWAKDRKLKIRSSEWLSEVYCQYRFFFKDKPPLEPDARSIVLKEPFYTDEDGYLIVTPGDKLIPRFQIIDSIIEKRHSSTVVYVKDEKIQDIVPMVISRQGQPYTDEILDYLRVLQTIKSLNTKIKVASSATGTNHQGTKPSSLLSAQIQIVGFHCAVFKNVGYYEALTPYCYTAPEVFQGKQWSYACDIWSIGCIIFRLLTGTNFLWETEECEVLDLIYQRAPGSLGEKYSPTTTNSSQSIEHYKLVKNVLLQRKP
ncbi:uncharacterized protein BKA55DRAFT_522859 [Fusarium redolens]|uniref:Protein kinase domain-containing protein n=1 Tax=Fusarium redolens TaxID=48865 RepID=A0A9P9G7G9_FUSRE|nr:uncharacterized protein BKA55DRAFT_522859 [Fusarium redolens]KAH7233926.1 hypothetical protein BKA55DRAFT_522859 [Fusarium redolens]